MSNAQIQTIQMFDDERIQKAYTNSKPSTKVKNTDGFGHKAREPIDFPK